MLLQNVFIYIKKKINKKITTNVLSIFEICYNIFVEYVGVEGLLMETSRSLRKNISKSKSTK